MTSQQESNIPVTDAKGLMAAASSMYKSIAEIKGDVSRLGKISYEEYNARIVEANNTHHELPNALEAWDYDQIESVGELLVQAAKKRMSATDIAALLKKNGYKATKKTGELAADLIRQVQTIPSGYFKAKPARVVELDEIKMIVAPDSMPVSLAKALDERGIPYTTYDGSETDRLEKLNAVEGVRFSDRDDSVRVDEMDEEGYNRYGWALLNDLLSTEECAKVLKRIADIRNNKQYPRTSDGGYIIPVGMGVDEVQNTLVVTNGDFEEPTFERIYFIRKSRETELEFMRGRIYDHEYQSHIPPWW